MQTDEEGEGATARSGTLLAGWTMNLNYRAHVALEKQQGSAALEVRSWGTYTITHYF